MVYLDNTTTRQQAWFPVAPTALDGTLTFLLRNNTDLTEWTVTPTAGGSFSWAFSGSFDRVQIRSSRVSLTLDDDMPVGEYTYTLSVDGSVVSTGLLWIGDLAEPDEYDTEINYEQYGE